MKFALPRFAAGLLAAAVLAGPAAAGDSPAFRGPAGNGISPEKKAPTTWSQSENVKWKVKLPARGNSSPIVSSDRVFLTCAEDAQGFKRSLYCFNRQSGDQLWVKTIDFGRKMPSHPTNPYCASTPAANGKLVVVFHGSAGLYCYDYQGNQQWQRDLGDFQHDWGYASSPVFYKDRVILNLSPGKNTRMAAFNLADGKTIWETPEEIAGDGEKRKDGRYTGTWSTPVLAKIGGADQIVSNMPTRVVGYNPQDGKVLWWCEGLSQGRGDLAYSSPVVTEDFCVVIGGFRGPAMGIQLGGTGDITERARKWRMENSPQSIGTGVVIGKHLYRPNAGRPGLIECLEPKTGKVVWSAVPGRSAWGSIIAVADNLYLTDQRGTTYVFKANPEKYEQIAENPLREPSNSTPAVSDGQIFIRTHQHLYCIEE